MTSNDSNDSRSHTIASRLTQTLDSSNLVLSKFKSHGVRRRSRWCAAKPVAAQTATWEFRWKRTLASDSSVATPPPATLQPNNTINYHLSELGYSNP